MARWLVRGARHAAWVALFGVGGSLLACSNNNSPPPDAYVAMSVGPGAGDACPFSSIQGFFAVGSSTGQKPTTVPDQGQAAGGTTSVACTVHPQGSGFDIQLSVSNNDGSILIESPSGMGAVTASTSSGVTATFSNASDGDGFSENNCTITYIYMNGPVSVSPPIAAGRIWGHISCPHATISGGMTTMGADGGSSASSCQGEADFLFENCNQ